MTDKERRRWEYHGMNADTYRGLLLDRLITEEREYRYVSGFDAKESLLAIIALRQELARLGEQL
jgi:hypothetical protein